MRSEIERTDEATTTVIPREEAAYPPPLYAWYVVGVLTLAYIFSFIDRQILNLLVGPIERDLHINDTQMSLLMGFSFAVFYTLFGIPLGRLADSRSRRAIIAIGVAVWSVLTAGCGLARRFGELALMRMGVGVGEASLSPAAYSLITDIFRPEQRATAISVYSMGIYVGSGLAFILGGLVVKFASGRGQFDLPLVGPTHAWQLVFVVVGLPGLLVSLLVVATVREPARRGARSTARVGGPAAPATLAEVWAFLKANRATLVSLNVGIACLTISSYGMSGWVPTFFGRKFGWPPGQIGLVFGSIVAIAGTLGITTGGRLADYLRSRGRTDAELWVAWLAALGWLPFGILYPLMPDATGAAVLLAPAVFFGSVPFGLAPAAIQRMTPNPMRAQATALYLFVINLIGMGLGPTAVALVTEQVFHDPRAVDRSLLLVGVAADFAAILLLWFGLKPYRQSVGDNLHREQEAAGNESPA
jgi:MFS family permease